MCIFSTVPTPVMVFDENLGLVEANERCYEYHGVDSVEKMKENIEKMGAWASVIDSVRNAIEGTSSIVEYCFQHPERKRKVCVRAAVSPIHDETGKLVGVSVLEKDMTLKKGMLQELTLIKAAYS